MKGPIIRILSFRFAGSEQDRENFDTWYNEVHIPHVLAAPGFLDGYRYRGTDDPNHYMTVYVFESLEALEKANAGLKHHLSQEEIEQWRNWEKGYITSFSRENLQQIYPA